MNVYKTALDLQDGVNMIAISGTLNRVCKQLMSEGLGTDQIRKHPAVTLIIDKMLDLNGRPDAMAFSTAYDECHEKSLPINYYDIAKKEGAKEIDGSIPGEEFERLGLPFMGGCSGCGESLSAYNMYPSKGGSTYCKNCIEDDGFKSIEEYLEYLTKKEK